MTHKKLPVLFINIGKSHMPNNKPKLVKEYGCPSTRTEKMKQIEIKMTEKIKASW
jgi:hypothetical protein